MLHVSPWLILTNLLQLLTIPVYVGSGVVMPFRPTVVVGWIIPMHAKVPTIRPVQASP